MAGRRVALCEVTDADYEYLYELATSQVSGLTWRLAGRVVDPETFVSVITFGVAKQAIMRRVSDGHPIGLVQCYGYDVRARHAKLSVIFDERCARRGWNFEGVVLFIGELFSRLPLRKLYLEGTRSELESLVRSSRETLVLEGVLPGHLYRAGSFVDAVTIAVYRDRWEAARRDLHAEMEPTSQR